jgi:1-deoxy-D-xylulose-5-phosphate reductoisomerase
MGNNVKRLAILGSTGSIGQQTLDVVRSFPERFRVVGLGAGRSTALLAKQIEEFQPELVSIDSSNSPEILHGLKCELSSGGELVASPDVDLVVMAISGKAGLDHTLAAIRAKKSIALATKEVLVMAGGIITAEAKKHGVKILPIDSEPSAIWQCLRGEEQQITRLILTASGGPFRHLTTEELRKVTPQQALAHPTWRMGPKITIDSATLMNKGFEAIEISWLFDVPIDNIEIVIHPQSIIHSMVEFADGSIKAQMSPPDMRLPIQYALLYPERLPNNFPHLDLSNTASLTLEPPDSEQFPCLNLALDASRKGGTYPAVLSTADEVAVALFLEERISFTDIPKLVAEALDEHHSTPHLSLEDVLAADDWARRRVYG